jgi:hypothetical protein
MQQISLSKDNLVKPPVKPTPNPFVTPNNSKPQNQTSFIDSNAEKDSINAYNKYDASGNLLEDSDDLSESSSEKIKCL